MKTEDDNQSINRDELRQEIRAEMSRQGRRRFLWGLIGSLVMLVVLIAVPVVGVASLGAKTGLVQVPLLSDWLYRPPESPERIVQPLVGTTPEGLLEILGARVSYNQATERLSMSVTEEELTTLLTASLTSEEVKEQVPQGSVESIQSTFEGDQIKLYVVTGWETNGIPVSLSIRPSAEGGLLVLEPSELVVGALGVPDFVAQTVVSSVSNSINRSLLDSLGGQVRLEDVSLADGRLNLSFSALR